MKFKAKVLPYYGNYGNWQSSAFDFPQIKWKIQARLNPGDIVDYLPLIKTIVGV